MMPTMSHHAAALGIPMMPYDGMGYYEQPRPRLLFKIPRTVADQKGKFDNDELFRKLSRETDVKYTGYKNQTLEERQAHFRNGVREGHAELAFTVNGTNLQIFFNPNDHHSCDFSKESDKVHLKSHSFIMNGVTVLWRGWMDLKRLDGSGCLEFVGSDY